MIFMEFYEKHKVLIHDFFDGVCGGKSGAEVMAWFTARTNDEIIILAFFARELPEVNRLLNMTLVQQVLVRGMNTDEIRDPEALAPS